MSINKHYFQSALTGKYLFLEIYTGYILLSNENKIYVNYNFTGYVQGMSDLLSPILVVMENEVDAFWCFAGLMERVVGFQ